LHFSVANLSFATKRFFGLSKTSKCGKIHAGSCPIKFRPELEAPVLSLFRELRVNDAEP
jgi:hypothetical protein